MDSKMPKEYVAELLKQLEELKRKKARKEKKLQKIKGCSLDDLKKERAIKVSHCSIEKQSEDQIKINEDSLKKLDGSFEDCRKNISERPNSNSFNDINFEKFSNSPSINDKEVSKIHHLLSLDNDEFNKDSKSHSDIKIKQCLVNVNEENIKNIDAAVTCIAEFSCTKDSLKHESYKTSESDLFSNSNTDKQTTNSENFEKHNLSLLSNSFNYAVDKPLTIVENAKMESVEHNLSFVNDDMTYDVEKTSSSPVIGNLKIQDSIFHNKDITNDIVEKIKQPNITDDLMSASETNTAKNVTNSCEILNKPSNESSKSLSNSKGKSSDILEDSLNSNMSFFMSADLFVNDETDNKDQNDGKFCVKNNKALSPIKEKDYEISNRRFPNPVQSHLSVNKPNDFDVFNFPKFSTPTEGNTQVEKDDNDIPDLVEKTQALSESAKEKTFKTVLPPANKSETPLLSFVLEKRLSSVLDAHYESPKKVITKTKTSTDSFEADVSDGNAFKKRKLFSENNYNIPSEIETHENLALNIEKSVEALNEINEVIKCDKFDNASAFDSGSFDSLKNVSTPPTTLVNNSCDDIPFHVSKAVDGLVNEVCVCTSEHKLWNKKSTCKNEACKEMNVESKMDSEILMIPETEGLGLYFSKDTEEFLETSTLSESMQDFPAKENFLNVSSQSKLESPIVNNIVAAVKSSKSFQNIHQENKIKLDMKMNNNNSLGKAPEKMNTKVSNDASSSFENSLDLNTSFMEDDTQDLGNFKQVPYMNDVNGNEKVMANEIKTDEESNLKFTCILSGLAKEPVMDVEIILFHDVKYAVLEYKTHICVWRQEKKEQWIKIFNHQIEDMFSLEKICVSMDENNLVIIMLLCNEEQYCLQFLIFERNTRVIKLMENTHWLEERCSEDSILLCGLSGLMFAIAQNKENPEVSIHALISLKENPRLMTAVLGSTETSLCSLCKIDKLPNALMGISDSMLYVWHIHEARLVTAVSLHPRDYISIKECFWATVESGLIFFLTTCEDDDYHVCQLLVANLATGLCKSAMTYSTLPSDNKMQRIIKAVYQEPYLIVAHPDGALLWSVMEEYCCASLSAIKHVTTIAISRDLDNFGLLAVGSKNGLIYCYSLQ